MKQPILTPRGKDTFELVEDFVYDDIIIRKGFVTDGASIPRIFWSIWPPNQPQHIAPALVHDYLTNIAVAADDYDGMVESDKIMRKAMKDYENSSFKAFAFYCSCRIYHYVKYKLLKKPIVISFTKNF